jgi:hypothetical protein
VKVTFDFSQNIFTNPSSYLKTEVRMIKILWAMTDEPTNLNVNSVLNESDEMGSSDDESVFLPQVLASAPAKSPALCHLF